MLMLSGDARECQGYSLKTTSHRLCHGQSWVDFERPLGLVILLEDQFFKHGWRYHMIMATKSQLDHGSCFFDTLTRVFRNVFHVTCLFTLQTLARPSQREERGESWKTFPMLFPGGWFGTWISCFHIVGNFIIPIDHLILFTGVYRCTTKQFLFRVVLKLFRVAYIDVC